jgi:hypothetical protein
MKYFKYYPKDVEFKPASIKHIHSNYLIIILILLSFVIALVKHNYTSITEYVGLEIKIQNLKSENDKLEGIISLLNSSDDFNETNLRLTLEGMNIMFVDIAIAQTKLETNNYKSKIFKESGNLFGMKAAKLRPYTHFGDYKGHADYKGSWKLSVIDYALWQAREAKNIKTEDQYFFLLSKLYAEDPNYVVKLKKIINNL